MFRNKELFSERGQSMSESEKEKKIFLSYCGSRDQELLTGRKRMTLGDMERFSFLTEFFGLESYGLNLWKEFGDDVEEPIGCTDQVIR